MSVRAESEHDLSKEQKDDKSSTLMLAVALSLPMPPVPPVINTALPVIGLLWISVSSMCTFAVGISEHFAIDIGVAQGFRALGVDRPRTLSIAAGTISLRCRRRSLHRKA